MTHQQLRELCEKATPENPGYRIAGNLCGTWREDIGVYMDPNLDNDLAFARGPMLDRQRFADEQSWREQARTDARFAKAARTAVPALLDENDALRAALREALNEWNSWEDDGHGEASRRRLARISELRSHLDER